VLSCPHSGFLRVPTRRYPGRHGPSNHDRPPGDPMTLSNSATGSSALFPMPSRPRYQAHGAARRDRPAQGSRAADGAPRAFPRAPTWELPPLVLCRTRDRATVGWDDLTRARGRPRPPASPITLGSLPIVRGGRQRQRAQRPFLKRSQAATKRIYKFEPPSCSGISAYTMFVPFCQSHQDAERSPCGLPANIAARLQSVLPSASCQLTGRTYRPPPP
jgi:hypothetical protein